METREKKYAAATLEKESPQATEELDADRYDARRDRNMDELLNAWSEFLAAKQKRAGVAGR